MASTDLVTDGGRSIGEATEIARCVTCLASDAADFINGSTICADGAQYFV